MRPIRRAGFFLFGAFFAVVILLMALSPDAAVNVTNNTVEPMNVRVVWRDQEASVGWVPPGASASFKICCEGEVAVIASASSGRSYKSEQIYFMSGWNAPIIEAIIESGEIHIEHNFAT